MNSKSLRVLFNSPHPGLHGGPPSHLPFLEEELRKYLALQPFRYGRKHDSETLPTKFLQRFRDLLGIRSQVRIFRPQIVHHNTAFDARAIFRDAPLLLLCRRYRIPVLLKMHGSATEAFGALNPLLTKMRHIVLKHASCIAVLSEAERQQFQDTWPFLRDRLKVVKNIIQPEFFAVNRRETESPTLLFNSRFIHQKGPFDLLEAIPGVLNNFPLARFIFIGSGAQADEFDRKVSAKSLNTSVQRVDFADNLSTMPYYAAAWGFVFPTHFPEGMPMVVAQALAVGLPIITTRTHFSRSYMQPMEHCLFIEPHNPRSIEEALVLLLQNPSLRGLLSANNRKLAGEFTTEIVAQEFMNIYDDILAFSSGQSLL